MDPIAIARGRSNVPSDYKDIIDAEDPTLIRRRTSFPHVWLQDENINNGFNSRAFPTGILNIYIYVFSSVVIGNVLQSKDT